MHHTKPVLLGVVALLAGCTAAAEPHQLPSASVTPHLEAHTAAVACGDDVALDGDAGPDIRYRYAYDDAGQLVHATGVHPAGGSDDLVDYTYDAAGNFTHMVESDGTYRAEIAATYDGAGNLVDYVWSEATATGSDRWDYAFSGFTGANPAREVITEQGQPAFGYDLAYDASGRLVASTDDSGDVTAWTYDDAALEITVDEGSGAFHGVIAYDGNDDELSETWGGSDPAAIASSDVYAWADGQLQSATFASGTTSAPQQLVTYEVDTLRYDCAAARAAASPTFSVTRPHAARHPASHRSAK